MMNRQRFIAAIRKRLPLRLHMTLILAATGFAGVGASKLILMAGVENVFLRYPLTVILSYLVFFAVVKLWLYLVSEAPSQSVVGDVAGNRMPDLPIPSFGGGGGATFSGGGGSFGGGGASGSFDGIADGVGDVAKGVGDAVGDAVGGVFDDEGGIAIVVVVAVLALLLCSVFGAGAYLVYQAPAILSEAAFNAVLAASLVRSSRRINEPDWMGSVFTATWKPFALILFFALVAGWAMHHYLPEAARIVDIIDMIRE